MHMKRDPIRPPFGFTLIEMVIAMVILGIASTGIIMLYGNLFYRRADIQSVEQGNLLIQSCSDLIKGDKANIFSPTTINFSTLNQRCQYLPKLLNSSMTLVVASSQLVSASPSCTASSTNCIQFKIHTENASWKSQDTTLLLINY